MERKEPYNSLIIFVSLSVLFAGILFFTFTPKGEEIPVVPLPVPPVPIPTEQQPQVPSASSTPPPPRIITIPLPPSLPSAVPPVSPTQVGLGRHFFDPDFGTALIQVT